MTALDHLDLAIVKRLQVDGRRPFTEIAQELNVSEGTIRNRVSRLLEDGYLQIVGMIDPHRMGLDAPAMIGVSLQAGKLESAVAAIARLPEVSYLVMVSGEFDLLVEVLCKDRDHLADFLNEKLRQVPGVSQTRTYTILRTYKMAAGANPVLSEPAKPTR